MSDPTMRETLEKIANTPLPEGRAGEREPISGSGTGAFEEKPRENAATEVTTETKPVETKPVEATTETKPVETKPVETKPVETKPVETKPVAQPNVGLRAPESWKPAIREQHWAKLPPIVQGEIYRREREIDTALKNSAEARRGMEQFNQLVGEYKDVFEFEKMPPLRSIGNLLNISRTLRFAPAPQRAQLMAQVIKGFDVDVQLLDQALSMLVGQVDPAQRAVHSQEQAIRSVLSQELAPIRDFMGNIQTARTTQAQAAEQQMMKEIQDFAADPANEYFEVVKDAMADIMEIGASRGQKISLQDAYQRAILGNNDLAAVYTAAKLKQAAGDVSSPAAQAQAKAGLSVTGAPSGSAAVAGASGSMREDIERAAASLAGRA